MGQMAPSPEETANALESCNAVMIGLGMRRFAIVRRGEPTHLRHVAGQRQRVRNLRPGDEVIYKGQRQIVRSLQVYE
jgi:hypothetical protein